MTDAFTIFQQNFITDVETNRALMGEGLRKSFVECMSERIPDEDSPNMQLVYVDDKCAMKRVGGVVYAFISVERTLLFVVADFFEFSSDDTLVRSEADNGWF